MQSILQALRDVLGQADFYRVLRPDGSYTWDYGAMIEYMVGALVLLVVISSVFRFLIKLFT